MVLTITILLSIKRQSLSFLTIHIKHIAIITIDKSNHYQCNIETISNSRDYYSRFNQLELQNIKSN